jgi:hypothetical protein
MPKPAAVAAEFVEPCMAVDEKFRRRKKRARQQPCPLQESADAKVPTGFSQGTVPVPARPPLQKSSRVQNPRCNTGILFTSPARCWPDDGRRCAEPGLSSAHNWNGSEGHGQWEGGECDGGDGRRRLAGTTAGLGRPSPGASVVQPDAATCGSPCFWFPAGVAPCGDQGAAESTGELRNGGSGIASTIGSRATTFPTRPPAP